MKDEKKYKHSPSNDIRLKDYLHNNMSDEERHQFENTFNEDPFVSDAIDGLMELNNLQKTDDIIEELHTYIDKKTISKRGKIFKPIQFPTWLVLLITLVFLTAIAGFILIKWLHK